MRVAVFGSWYEERSGFICTGTLEAFRQAANELGRLLARSGIELIVLSSTDETVDGFVAAGLLEELESGDYHKGQTRDWVTIVNYDQQQSYVQGENSLSRFAELFARSGRHVTYRSALGRLLFDRHLTALRLADAAITIGGANHTFLAGEVALFAGVPLIPIASFGGASRVLLEEAARAGTASHSSSMRGKLFGPWCDETLRAVHHLLSGYVISIIHGHSDGWRNVQELVRKSSTPAATFEPVVMRELLEGTESLATKWESIGNRSAAAIAVVTPDDVGGLGSDTETAPRARQNVWLEIGWIWGRLGRGRLLLLVQGNVEFPSDLAGVEYVRFERQPAEVAGAIQAFLTRVAGSADRS